MPSAAPIFDHGLAVSMPRERSAQTSTSALTLLDLTPSQAMPKTMKAMKPMKAAFVKALTSKTSPTRKETRREAAIKAANYKMSKMRITQIRTRLEDLDDKDLRWGGDSDLLKMMENEADRHPELMDLLLKNIASFQMRLCDLLLHIRRLEVELTRTKGKGAHVPNHQWRCCTKGKGKGAHVPNHQ